MRLLRDFVCVDCGASVERYVDTDVTTMNCTCGSEMMRTIGMPHVALDGTDPGFPGAYERWANKREQRAKIARSKSYYTGD
jgi:hypothetical protein